MNLNYKQSQQVATAGHGFKAITSTHLQSYIMFVWKQQVYMAMYLTGHICLDKNGEGWDINFKSKGEM